MAPEVVDDVGRAGSQGGLLLPEAVRPVQPRPAKRTQGGRRRGPPGRRVGRAWHGAAGGGTAFVLSWRPPRRAVPCMWMRPLRAPPSPPSPRPSPRPPGWRKAPLGSDGLRAAPGLGWGLGSGPGLRAEHRGASRAVQGVWPRRGTFEVGGGDLGIRSRRTPGGGLGGRSGGGHRRSFSLSAPVGVRHSWRPLPPAPETRSAAAFLKEPRAGAGWGRRRAPESPGVAG